MNTTSSGSRPAALRLLLAGLHNSPHMHRWLDMIRRPDAAIVVFPSLAFGYDLPDGFGYVRLSDLHEAMPAGVWVVDPRDVKSPDDPAANRRHAYRPWVHSFVSEDLIVSPLQLVETIRRLRPRFVHSMEIQLAGYLCREVASRMGRDFPPWIVSSWGSDLSLFRKLRSHPRRLRRVCGRADLFMADCERDLKFARTFGYRGPTVPIVPSSGGMDIEGIAALASLPPSRRKRIVLKSNHNWAGRALIAFSGLWLARHHLDGYAIDLVGTGEHASRWGERFENATGIPVTVRKYMKEHHEVLRILAEARVVVGASISDGLPTTVLEAMALGTFPIQTSTSCIDEWIEDGRDGCIVDVHDSRSIADAVILALGNDDLVDRAAVRNLEVVRKRWDLEANRGVVWETYEKFMLQD